MIISLSNIKLGGEGYDDPEIILPPDPPYGTYFEGLIDIEGFKELGWGDRDIGNLIDDFFSTANTSYAVSDYDKTIDPLVTHSGDTQMTAAPYTTETISDNSWFKGCTALQVVPSINVTTLNYFFLNCGNLKKVGGITYRIPSNLRQVNCVGTFYMCSNLKKTPMIKLRDASEKTWFFCDRTYYGCSSLETIPEFNKPIFTLSNAFYGCSKLKNIKFAPEILLCDIDLSMSPELTIESLLSVLEAAYPQFNHTITFGPMNLAKLTDEQKAIATNKGWILK